jgi:hypothetical protein
MATKPTTTKLGELVEVLSEPFAVEEHEYRVVAQTKSGFWMAYYVDLRKMEERLQRALPAGSNVVFSIKEIDEVAEAVYALGSLRIEIPDGEGKTFYEVTDAGYAVTSSAEPPKSAVTDLYRRLLSHFGIGRYLYHLPKIHLSGKNDGGRFIYDADPLEALRHALSLTEKERPEVLFYPPKRQGDVEAVATRSTAVADIKDEWLDYFGVDSKEEAVDAFVDEVGVTRKQAVVYMRNTTPEASEGGIDKPTVKAFLDKLLGSKK